MAYIKGECREQITFFPEVLDDYVNDNNQVRFIEAFVNNLKVNGFTYSQAKSTGRAPHDPKCILKLYIYGYLNGIRSSRKLEKETHRNVEVMWLMQKLTPDHKTIANFRKDNSLAIKQVLADTGYYNNLETKKCIGNGVIPYVPKPTGNNEAGGYGKSKFKYDKESDKYICPKGEILNLKKTIRDKKGVVWNQYRCKECLNCENKAQCTKSKSGRIIERWENEEMMEEMSLRLELNTEKFRKRKTIVEPVFGIIKRSMGHGYLL